MEEGSVAQSKSFKELNKEELGKAFFGLNNRIFYYLGFEESNKRFVYRVYGIVFKLFILAFLTFQFWYLFTESHNYVEWADAFLVVLIIYRYKNMMDNEVIFKKLVKAMELPHFDISTASRQNKLKYWIKVNDLFSKIVLGLSHFTLFIWYLFPLFDDIKYNMCVVIRIPFNYQTPILYPITYTLVVMGVHSAGLFIMCNDMIVQTHFIFLVCQFSILGDCFENVFNDCLTDVESNDEVAIHQKLKDKDFASTCLRRFDDLIEHHQTLLRHTQELRSILSVPMMALIGIGGPHICSAAYQVTRASGTLKIIMSLLYVGYYMFEILIFCLWSDGIREQSEHIRDAAYSCGWEQGLGMIPGMRSRVMLVIARATQPMLLTAGGMADLSLETYGSIIKTCYSILTMMLNMENEE